MNHNAVAIVAEALGVSQETITPETGLMTSVEWDSLAHFRIVLSLEEQLGRPLDPLEITTLTNLASVQALLNSE